MTVCTYLNSIPESYSLCDHLYPETAQEFAMGRMIRK